MLGNEATSLTVDRVHIGFVMPYVALVKTLTNDGLAWKIRKELHWPVQYFRDFRSSRDVVIIRSVEFYDS